MGEPPSNGISHWILTDSVMLYVFRTPTVRTGEGASGAEAALMMISTESSLEPKLVYDRTLNW